MSLMKKFVLTSLSHWCIPYSVHGSNGTDPGRPLKTRIKHRSCTRIIELVSWMSLASLIDHIWSVIPSAIAGVLCIVSIFSSPDQFLAEVTYVDWQSYTKLGKSPAHEYDVLRSCCNSCSYAQNEPMNCELWDSAARYMRYWSYYQNRHQVILE